MSEAAAVPVDVDSSKQLKRTLTFCADTDEWVAALEKYPAAGVYESYDQEKSFEFLRSLCASFPDGKVCADAEKRGVLDYTLDEAREALKKR